MLNINFTLLIQIANFLFLVFLLNFILYRPIRRILARRKEESESLRKMVEDYQNRAAENEQGIEKGMVQARKDGFIEKEKIREEGLERERGILQQATASMEEKMAGAKKEMEVKVMEARKSLEGQIAGFSGELAEKILGRSFQ